MPFQIDIEARGIGAISRASRELGERSENFVPIAYKVRDRWLESEKRLFSAAPWPGKKASTIKRYQHPMNHFAAGGAAGFEFTPGRGATKPLIASGLLKRTLTEPQATGQRDSVKKASRGLDLAFGVQAGGPVAYGNFQPSTHGGRLARDPFSFDDEALTASTDDVRDFVIGAWGNSR